jgi:hypothetical protein
MKLVKNRATADAGHLVQRAFCNVQSMSQKKVLCRITAPKARHH